MAINGLMINIRKTICFIESTDNKVINAELDFLFNETCKKRNIYINLYIYIYTHVNNIYFAYAQKTPFCSKSKEILLIQPCKAYLKKYL